MKKFTKKELKKIRKYFNEVKFVDQTVGSANILEVEFTSRGFCLFCNLAIALGLATYNGLSYDFIDSFYIDKLKAKRDYFYDSLRNYLLNEMGLEGVESLGKLDWWECSQGVKYNELISKHKGCFGDFLVEKVLI